MRDMDRRLREEQDLEFQRTMEADRKRIEEEERKKQEEEEKLKKIEERENERIRRTTEQRVSFHCNHSECPDWLFHFIFKYLIQLHIMLLVNLLLLFRSS